MDKAESELVIIMLNLQLGAMAFLLLMQQPESNE